MSRKSKGECTCKIVAQNERGMLGQVRDSVYRGVKYYGEDGQVEKRFCFPRKLAEEKWLEWLDADLTEDELRILEPLNRKQGGEQVVLRKGALCKFRKTSFCTCSAQMRTRS